MPTTDQVVHLMSDRLIAAEDKQIARDWVLRQINRMRHKAGRRPISFEEKKKIVELLATRVTGQARSEGLDSAPYATMINYILENLENEPNGGAQAAQS